MLLKLQAEAIFGEIKSDRRPKEGFHWRIIAKERILFGYLSLNLLKNQSYKGPKPLRPFYRNFAKFMAQKRAMEDLEY